MFAPPSRGGDYAFANTARRERRAFPGGESFVFGFISRTNQKNRGRAKWRSTDNVMIAISGFDFLEMNRRSEGVLHRAKDSSAHAVLRGVHADAVTIAELVCVVRQVHQVEADFPELILADFETPLSTDAERV